MPVPPIPGFFYIGRGEALGVPVPVLIAVAVVAAGWIVLQTTTYGRRVVAVGSNPEAARRVGMPARWTIASVYGVSGAASALAGLMIASRLGSGSSNAAVGFELQVIAAVVLGGTSLMGGRGTILGTVLGALTIAAIGNGLILLHVSPFFTQIVTGRDHPDRDLAQHTHLLGTHPAEAHMSELSEAHAGSGLAMTVLGPMSIADLGMTLMHEHILNDCACWWNPPGEGRRHLADAPLTPSILWELRQDPFVAKANLALDGRARRHRRPRPVRRRGRAHRGRSHLPRHRARSDGPPAHRPRHGVQHCHGRGLLPPGLPPARARRHVRRRHRRRDRRRGAGGGGTGCASA